MTVAELMTTALTELNENATTVTEVGWTPKYWDYTTFRSYTIKAINEVARRSNIELKDVDLSATVFYDTEIDDMPAFDADTIFYRLYPTPTEADDDSATEAYFYINSDDYEPKKFRLNDEIIEVKTIDYMDNNYYDWRDAIGTPTMAIIQGITQSSTGETTPDHSDDFEIIATAKAFGAYTLDSATIPLPDKLEDALVYNICERALRKIGIEEDQNRAQLYTLRCNEELRKFDIDNLAGRIPTVKRAGGFS